mmetsp:Transcript_21632/g.53647  ORF Transcript_21632/g.53647 Transcript_21632/m.53647 type:complete len:272 (+) Transcript_21632:375-1190(+)
MTQKLVINVSGDTRVVNRKRLESVLHAIKGGTFPDVFHNVVVVDLVRNASRRTQLQFDFSVANALDISDAFPGFAVEIGGPIAKLEAQLVANHDSRLLHSQSMKGKGGDVLSGQGFFPPHRNVFFRQRLLHLPIVICFDLDQWGKNVLVMKSVFVLQQSGLHFFVFDDIGTIEVRKFGIRLVLPEFFELCHLRLRNITSSQKQLIGWFFDEPREELAILDQRVPLREFPIHVFQSRDGLHTDAAEEHHNAGGTRGNKPQHKDVFGGTVVAF